LKWLHQSVEPGLSFRDKIHVPNAPVTAGGGINRGLARNTPSDRGFTAEARRVSVDAL
jgi:hypothetical protein